MTFEQLDVLRGYSIAAVILSIVAIGAASILLPVSSLKARCLVRLLAGLVGGVAAVTIFFLFNFISGWNEYFASKSTGAGPEAIEYHGRHQAAARVIRTLGEMDVSTLGVVFGLVGMFFIAVAYVNFRALRKA